LGNADVPSQSVVKYDGSTPSWGAPARVTQNKKVGIMGDRGQVKIVAKGSPDLYLYTHWGAEFLPNLVANALDRGRSRWGDNEYLNRVIFSEMIEEDVQGLLGFGIGFSEHGDVWRVVEINYDDQTVDVRDLDYENWDINDPISSLEWEHDGEPMPYELYIAHYAS
jgi:hypothetical protein